MIFFTHITIFSPLSLYSFFIRFKPKPGKCDCVTAIWADKQET